MREQFRCIGGRDLAFDFRCACSRKIRLSGYADDYFFDRVNAKPTKIECNCGRNHEVQWFRDGVEVTNATT